MPSGGTMRGLSVQRAGLSHFLARPGGAEDPERSMKVAGSEPAKISNTKLQERINEISI